MVRIAHTAMSGLLQPTLGHLAAARFTRCHFEQMLAFLGHRLTASRAIDALAFHWAAALDQRQNGELLRTARIQGSTQLTVDLRDYFHRHLFFTGKFEPETTAYIMSLLRPGDVFLDVGANMGYYACLAARLGSRVHAFEPNPTLARQLERSSRLNGFGAAMTINQVAVSPENGMAELFLSADPQNTGLSSLLALPGLSQADRVSVPTITLDSYCRRKKIGSIRLIKIDVEGAELGVLAGANSVLHDLRPYAIICEVAGFTGGANPRDVLNIFASAGYLPFVITRYGLSHASDALWQDDHEKSRLPPNICFLRDASGAVAS